MGTEICPECTTSHPDPVLQQPQKQKKPDLSGPFSSAILLYNEILASPRGFEPLYSP